MGHIFRWRHGGGQKLCDLIAHEDVIIYEVYNKEREKIDVFQPTTKLRFYGILPLGTNAMYLQYSSGDENDPSWGIVRWDKQIGTYHGEPIDKDIVDIPR